MSHPDEQLLIRFALGEGEGMKDGPAIAAHLEACDSCSSFVADVAEIDRLAADPDTWWLSSELLTGAGRAPLLDFRDRLKQEDDEAARLLEPLLVSSYKFAYADIARKPRYRSGGVVRRLCREANRQCEREPLYALTLAETAHRIAEALPDDCYPAANVWRLRGDALVEIAIACRYLGSRFQQAYDSLNRATRAYHHLLAYERELARIAYVRGTVLWTQQRYTEALEEERVAAARYASIGDMEGFERASLVEAIQLMRLHRFSEARAAFERLYASAEGRGSDIERARAGSSLASCLIEMGDTGHALPYAIEAEHLFAEAQLPTEVARMRWTIAYAMLVAGNIAEAEARLTSVVAEFADLEMESDAALVKLDLLEVHVATERYGKAAELAVGLADYFKTHDMLTGALTAAAFLEEAARQRRLTRAHVSAVREYLRRLPEEPHLLFKRPD